MSILANSKICFLAGTLEHGGAERQLFYMLLTLRQAGAMPRLLSLDTGEFWEDKIRALGVPITWVRESSRLKRVLRVLKEVRKEHFEILQSQHFYANAYVGWAARLIRRKSIGALRSNGRVEMQESGRLGGWFNLHSPAMLAANSKNAAAFAVARGVSKSRVFFLPNVVDTDFFQPIRGGSQKVFTLVAVGRLVSEKRFDKFISILSKLKTVYGLKVRGLIVGGGCLDEDLRPQLEDQARRLGLTQDELHFAGSVADTRAIYGESSVCVLNSDYEGTPNVLLEAMASGLPVVASNVGGVPDIVTDGQTGFLFEKDQLDGFAAAIARLEKSPELLSRMGQRARAFVEENHSLHRLPKYLEQLYQPAPEMDPAFFQQTQREIGSEAGSPYRA